MNRLTDDQRATILDVDPDFFLTEREIQLRAANQRIEEYCSFYLRNQRQPRTNSQDREERRLGKWRTNVKRAVNGLGDTLPLNDEQRTRILFVDPDFFQDLDFVRNQRIEEYIAFYVENRRQPKPNSSDKDEKRVAQWRIRMRGLGATQHLNDDQQAIILDD
jgi:hypothetical protein